MIAIIDYDGGNFKSVINILKRLKIDFILTNKRNEILNSKKLFYPVFQILVIVSKNLNLWS